MSTEGYVVSIDLEVTDREAFIREAISIMVNRLGYTEDGAREALGGDDDSTSVETALMAILDPCSTIEGLQSRAVECEPL